jgi:hypothetical protein
MTDSKNTMNPRGFLPWCGIHPQHKELKLCRMQNYGIMAQTPWEIA